MKMDSGHEAVAFGDDERAKQMKDFGDFVASFVRLQPGGCILPKKYLEFANRIYNIELRASDVLVLTYPKCGTTWTQEIIWTMQNNPDLTNPLASKSIHARAPFLEFDFAMPVPKMDSKLPNNPIFEAFLEMCPGKNPEDGINLQLAEAIPNPRTIKTHLPFSLMHPSLLDAAKVVFVARNPKDVIISYHHHFKAGTMINYRGSFEDFVQYFVDGDLLNGPYSLYLREAWERRDHPNLHIILYEDLKNNPLGELKRLNTFLNTNLTEEQLKGVVRHTSFGEMKSRHEKQKAVMSKGADTEAEQISEKKMKQEYVQKEGGFFRKGEVGDWQNKFIPELEAKVDQWIRDNLSDLGFNFRYGN